MTKDGSGTGYLYTFDAEGRLTLAAGPSGGPYCYVYDGLGLRVAKKSNATTCSSGTVSKLYWRGIAGDALAESDSTGSTTNAAYVEYVFFAGHRVASRDGDGTGAIFYYFADHLGSTRTITTGSGPGQTPGQLCYDADFTPYGQEISYAARLQTTACPPSYKFTGYERDSETGVDYAFARYYSSRLGRFLSTDPLGGAIGDPQSHNAYAYTGNNPLNFIDPSGMSDCPDLKIGCMPSNECLNGVSMCGAPGVDLFGGFVRSFWAGEDAAVQHGFLQAIGLISTFDIVELANTPYFIMHISNDGVWSVIPRAFYPFEGLLDLLKSPSGGRGNSSGGPQQPSKTSERLERLKNCALGYYGIDPLSVTGLAGASKYGVIAAGAGGIPKAIPEALGIVRTWRYAGASRFTSIFSILSVATGAGGWLRTVANFGSKTAAPIFIASVLIDTAAIAVCTASD